jgi:hypothetical protein
VRVQLSEYLLKRKVDGEKFVREEVKKNKEGALDKYLEKVEPIEEAE